MTTTEAPAPTKKPVTIHRRRDLPPPPKPDVSRTEVPRATVFVLGFILGGMVALSFFLCSFAVHF